MKTVTINTLKLLDIINENRAKHIKDYDEAIIGYRAEAEKQLKDMIKKVRGGEPISHILTLMQPVNNVADYDRNIRMLELSDTTTVEISEQEFKQYVMDDWQWTASFKQYVDTYNGK